eukprot:COSAG03_NODE_2957_length_2327_cov_13.450628_1_plen_43_part_10
MVRALLQIYGLLLSCTAVSATVDWRMLDQYVSLSLSLSLSLSV